MFTWRGGVMGSTLNFKLSTILARRGVENRLRSTYFKFIYNLINLAPTIFFNIVLVIFLDWIAPTEI